MLHIIDQEHISKEKSIEGNDSLHGDETGEGGDGSQSALASEGSESYPSDIGEGGEGSVDRWQKLLWKAIKMEHEVWPRNDRCTPLVLSPILHKI